MKIPDEGLFGVIAAGGTIVAIIALTIYATLKWIKVYKERRAAPPVYIPPRKVNKHAEYLMNVESPGNSYKKELSNVSSDFGGYYGMEPAGFGKPRPVSNMEQNYVHPMAEDDLIPKPVYPLSNGKNGPPEMNRIRRPRKPTLYGKPVHIGPEYHKLEHHKLEQALSSGGLSKLEATLGMRKSLDNNKNHDTGSVKMQRELMTANSLSQGNNFESAFGRNSSRYGDSTMQMRYIKPVDKQTTPDLLGFTKI